MTSPARLVATVGETIKIVCRHEMCFHCILPALLLTYRFGFEFSETVNRSIYYVYTVCKVLLCRPEL